MLRIPGRHIWFTDFQAICLQASNYQWNDECVIYNVWKWSSFHACVITIWVDTYYIVHLCIVSGFSLFRTLFTKHFIHWIRFSFSQVLGGFFLLLTLPQLENWKRCGNWNAIPNFVPESSDMIGTKKSIMNSNGDGIISGSHKMHRSCNKLSVSVVGLPGKFPGFRFVKTNERKRLFRN